MTVDWVALFISISILTPWAGVAAYFLWMTHREFSEPERTDKTVRQSGDMPGFIPIASSEQPAMIAELSERYVQIGTERYVARAHSQSGSARQWMSLHRDRLDLVRSNSDDQDKDDFR